MPKFFLNLFAQKKLPREEWRWSEDDARFAVRLIESYLEDIDSLDEECCVDLGRMQAQAIIQKYCPDGVIPSKSEYERIIDKMGEQIRQSRRMVGPPQKRHWSAHEIALTDEEKSFISEYLFSTGMISATILENPDDFDLENDWITWRGAVHNYQTLIAAKRSGYTHARIMSLNNSCPVCIKQHHKEYPIDELLEAYLRHDHAPIILPRHDCARYHAEECRKYCRCGWSPTKTRCPPGMSLEFHAYMEEQLEKALL